MRTGAEPLIEKWVDAVAALLRGRSTRSELERDFQEFYAALLPLVGKDGKDVSGPEYGEIRSFLEEYSRARVRAGFTPTETASSLFSLKRVVFDLTENSDDPQVYRQQIAF